MRVTLARAAGLSDSVLSHATIAARSSGFFKPAKFIFVPGAYFFGFQRKKLSDS